MDRALEGRLLEDAGLLHPSDPRKREFPSNVFMDVDLPSEAADTEIVEVRVDKDTRDVQIMDEYEGGTQAVHVDVGAVVVVRALVPDSALPLIGPHVVLDPDVDEGWTQMTFRRSVAAEFEGTIDIGAENTNWSSPERRNDANHRQVL